MNELRETKGRLEETRWEFMQVLEMFGEDSNTMPDEYFAFWSRFATAFQRAMRENEKEAVMAEKAAKRAAAKQQRVSIVWQCGVCGVVRCVFRY